MTRSFTIDAIYKKGHKIRFDGGRYLSETASGAARKAFSQAVRYLGISGRLSLEIHMRETTQSSNHKTYKYRVTRVNQDTEVERSGQTFIYTYATKVRSLN